MIRGGKPTRLDRRDFDFFKSHGFGALTAVPNLPDEFNTDAGFWMPDQQVTQTYAVPGFPDLTVPAMFEGCTDWATADICVDQDKKLYNPLDIENITHANANGGGDLRTALKAAVQLGWIKQFFNIQANGILDWLDAFKVAQYSAQPEIRSLTIGTKWYKEFNSVGIDGILPIPTNFNDPHATWHDWAGKGWVIKNGVTYLKCKPWEGSSYGDNGFVYISRELINALMNIKGTAAFTSSDLPKEDIVTIGSVWVQNIVNFVLSILSKSTTSMPSIHPTTPVEQPAPSTPVKETLGQRIVAEAESWLNQDPTPDDVVPDDVACVSSLVKVTAPVLNFDLKLSYTPDLYNVLLKDKRFKLVSTPTPGTIVISPTKGQQHGHCGVYLTDNLIASNNSFGGVKGLWTQNYSRQEWRDYFGTKLGLVGYLFAPVDNA